MVSRRILESDDAVRTVGDLHGTLVKEGSRVREDAPISEVIELLLARMDSRVAHVLDPAGRLVGTVSWRSVLKAAAARHGVRDDRAFSLLRLFRELHHERAEDLMRPATAVSLNDTLRDVLVKMERAHENDLPIVAADGRYLGEVNGVQVMRLALATFRETEAALDRARQG